MDFILRIVVLFLVYGGMLYILNRVFDTFTIESGGIISVTLILIGVDFVIGWFLRFIGHLVTLYIFYFLIAWVVNSIIMYITDKLSNALTIKSTGTLILSGFALAAVHVIYPIIRDIVIK